MVFISFSLVFFESSPTARIDQGFSPSPFLSDVVLRRTDQEVVQESHTPPSFLHFIASMQALDFPPYGPPLPPSVLSTGPPL